MHWSTPGGTISRTMENFGIHHLGEFTIYFGGFVIPVVYGCMLAYLGVRLINQTGDEDDEDLQGQRIGIFLTTIGIITVIGCAYSQFCEVSSRYLQMNPKVNVTLQDTFKKRRSLDGPPTGEIIIDYDN
jgi:hypothetical protein